MFTPIGIQGALTIAADQPDGNPDTQFNQNVAAALPANFNVSDFRVGPDDQIVVFGNAGSSNDVLRLNSDGTLDTSFGTDGVTVLPSEDYATYSPAAQIRVEPDGRLVLLFEDDVIRLRPAGTLDPSFGTGGVVQFASLANPLISEGLALQPDGKVLLSATIPGSQANTQTLAVLRFNVDGTRDVTFGIGGLVTLAPTGTVLSPTDTVGVVDAAVSPNGNIDLYLARTRYQAGRDLSAGYIEQLTATGAINPRFGNHGRSSASLLSGGHHRPGSMLVDAEGHIIVASVQEFGSPSIGGLGLPTTYATDYGGVLRLTSTGRRDPTFGHRGVRVLAFGRYNLQTGRAQAWLYPPNGDIVAQCLVGGDTTVALLDSPLRV